MVSRRIAALAAALALFVPATAMAQSAGDDQYQDPFGGDEEQSQDNGSQSPDTPTSSGDTGTDTTTTTQTPTAPAETSPATAQTAQAAQLPRTGGDVVLPAVAGFWLLLGGVALRARVRLHDGGA
jgi:hypothetical protein